LPYLRPPLTFVADSLAGYRDPEGTNMHDLLGTRCDPYVNRMFAGVYFDLHCHPNLTRAVRGRELTEWDVHDVLEVLQASGLNSDTQNVTMPCPGRDQSLAMWGPDAASMDEQLAHCHPLLLEVFAVPDEARSGWLPPESPPYRVGGDPHGLVVDGSAASAGDSR